MSITAQQAVFHDRVGRILSGKGVVTMGTVFVGDETSFRRVPGQSRTSARTGWLRQALLFPSCVLAGFTGHVLVLLADWHLSGQNPVGATADMVLARQAGIALAVTLALTLALRLGDRSMLLAKGLGVVLGLMLFHNLVHQWPAAFDQVFSPDWTAQVLAATEPQTLLIRGTAVAF